MSIEVTTAIYQQLIGDANVTAKVGIFEGAEAIFTGLVPERLSDESVAYVVIPPPFSAEPMSSKTGDLKSREEICKLLCVTPTTFSIVEIEALEKAVRDSLHRTDLGTVGPAVMEIAEVDAGLDLSDRDYFVRTLDVRVVARE